MITFEDFLYSVENDRSIVISGLKEYHRIIIFQLWNRLCTTGDPIVLLN